MEDSQIIQLYWDRNQEAITATSEKYGKYCSSIARNILKNAEDAEECVNDTYLNAWNAMPPERPAILISFLGCITRNLSFNRYRLNRAKKRGGGEIPLVLEELGDCVSGKNSVEQEIDRKELAAAINSFLEELSKEKRQLFISRYWYAESITDIATRFSASEGKVMMTLSRLRKLLRSYLEERGFVL